MHGGEDAQQAATAGTGEDIEGEGAAQEGGPGPGAGETGPGASMRRSQGGRPRALVGRSGRRASGEDLRHVFIGGHSCGVKGEVAGLSLGEDTVEHEGVLVEVELEADYRRRTFSAAS